jgi:hypothetical protein
MTPRLRRFALTAHVVSSVGWLGAVVVFLALALVGLLHDDPRVVRSAYVTMEATAGLVLVPLAVAAFVTGVIQGLGTHWGLIRHYWVLIKLIITVVATVVLQLYLQTLGSLAALARDGDFGAGDLGRVRSPSPVLHAAAAIVLLLVTTALAIYKPKGQTGLGRRRGVAR